VSGTQTVAVRSLDGTALSTTLTRTGTVMGTPRYMAPEQHLGEAIDPRTDQFAFCVALYEALFGKPPFAGDTYGALADHVIAGEVAPPPPSRVPPHVRVAILRGLARKPEDRFPSMTALLAELTPVMPGRWRWIVPLAITGVFALAIATFFIQRSHRETVRDAFDRAQDAFNHGDYAAAAAGFRHAFQLDPDLGGRAAPYIYNMAASYKKLGNCPEAVNGFRQYLALSRNPDDREKVEAELRNLGDCGGLLSADVAYQAGQAAYNAGDYQKAIEEFKRGFALEPDISKKGLTYLFNLGQAYRQVGNCKEASFAYSRFLALKTDVAPEQRQHIEQLIKELDDCAVQQGSATR
jgi:tetratricopeptide (TPR) repeat protein